MWIKFIRTNFNTLHFYIKDGVKNTLSKIESVENFENKIPEIWGRDKKFQDILIYASKRELTLI